MWTITVMADNNTMIMLTDNDTMIMLIIKKSGL